MTMGKFFLMGLALLTTASASFAGQSLAGEEMTDSWYRRITSPSYTREYREASREAFVRERGYDPGYIDPGYTTVCQNDCVPGASNR